MTARQQALRFLPIVILVTLLTGIGWNIHSNLALSGLSLNYGVFWDSAGFDVSERLIPYNAGDSYAHVIVTGLLNTLLLAVVSLVTATVIGIALGFASTGSRWSLRVLTLGYVELFRNQPKILILLVIFVVTVQSLPPVRAAWEWGGLVLSNRALMLPSIETADLRVLFLLGVGSVGTGWFWRARRRAADHGVHWPGMWLPFGVIAGVIAGLAHWGLIEVAFDWPTRSGFDYQGGIRISMQFLTVWLCLALYHGAQIAEVVRGGIQAIPSGQFEAARALGLSAAHIRRMIVWPQTLRLIFPPLGNQYLNGFKNTSIAIAVGYSDLMSVTGTMINQTFRPIEAMTVTIAIYMVFCLLIAWSLRRLSDRLAVH